MALIDFLRARLDEDEQMANLASGVPWIAMTIAAICENKLAYGHLGFIATVEHAEDLTHVARHDPARVLAEVDAKRRIIDEVLRYEAKIDAEWGGCHEPAEIAAGECHETDPNQIVALRLLALPYAGHRDFLDEWRP